MHNKFDFTMDRQAYKVYLYTSWTTLVVMKNIDLYKIFKESLYDTRISINPNEIPMHRIKLPILICKALHDTRISI